MALCVKEKNDRLLRLDKKTDRTWTWSKKRKKSDTHLVKVKPYRYSRDEPDWEPAFTREDTPKWADEYPDYVKPMKRRPK